MDKKMGVANIVNKNNGMKYTIRSTNLEKIIDDYISKLKNGKHPNQYLQRDFNKGDKFEVEIIKSDCKSESEINSVGNREIEKNRQNNKSYNKINGNVSFNGGNTNPYPTSKTPSQINPLGTIDIGDDLFDSPINEPKTRQKTKRKTVRKEEAVFPKARIRTHKTNYDNIKKRECSNCGSYVFDFVKRCPHCNTVVKKNLNSVKHVIKSNDFVDFEGNIIKSYFTVKKVEEDVTSDSKVRENKIKKTKIGIFRRKICVNCGKHLKCTVKKCMYCGCTEFKNEEECKNPIKHNFKRKTCVNCGRQLKCIVTKCPYCSCSKFIGTKCKKENKQENVIEKDMELEENTKEIPLEKEEDGIIFKRKRCENCGREVKVNVEKCMYCSGTEFSSPIIYKKEDLPEIYKVKNLNINKKKNNQDLDHQQPKESKKKSSVTLTGDIVWKQCDKCNKKVNVVAKKCPYCGYVFSKSKRDPKNMIKNEKIKLLPKVYVKDDFEIINKKTISNDENLNVKDDFEEINKNTVSGDEIKTNEKPKKSKGIFGFVKSILKL